MKINLKQIDTEQRNSNSYNIDKKNTLEILKIINNEDATIANAIKEKLPIITKVIDLIFTRFKQGGRLIYMGAGTSGRIGILDASEMLPTYGIDNDRITAIIAGGDKAIKIPQEGAEDNQELAIADLKNINLTALDTVIGIGASGRTPYVLAALEYCQEIGALAIGLCMTKNSQFAKVANFVISINTGPEAITGSTRMKAATATKLVCNMISTTLMIKYGKVYQNLMVDLIATNEKLKARVFNIISEITKANSNDINKVLAECNYSCKDAIVMLLKKVNFLESTKLLKEHNNQISNILKTISNLTNKKISKS